MADETTYEKLFALVTPEQDREAEAVDVDPAERFSEEAKGFAENAFVFPALGAADADVHQRWETQPTIGPFRYTS